MNYPIHPAPPPPDPRQHRLSSFSPPLPPHRPPPTPAPLAPQDRLSPTLSRSSSYLASLGPAPPTPPASAPPFFQPGYDPAVTASPLEQGITRSRTTSPGAGRGSTSRGWRPSLPPPAPSPYPPVDRPDHSRRTSSSSSSGNGNGHVGGSSNGGRKLQKPRRSSGQSGTASTSPSPPTISRRTSAYTLASSSSRSPYPPVATSAFQLAPAPLHAQSAPVLPPTALASPAYPPFPPGPAYPSPYPPLNRTVSSPYPPVAAGVGAERPRPYGGLSAASVPPPLVPPKLSDAELHAQRQLEAEQLARTQHESLKSERARLAALRAADERALREAVALSAEHASQERLRAAALERERRAAEEKALMDAIGWSQAEEERKRAEEARRLSAEEREMVRAVEASREAAAARARAKGKGRATDDEDEEGPEEDEWTRREREALEMAMQLSLEEEERHWGVPGGDGAAGTSAQADGRYPRGGEASAVLVDGDSASLSSAPPHPVFPGGAVGSPPSTSTAPLPASTSSSDIPPPPAYEHPPHAAENDEPGDIILGPGCPAPPPDSSPDPAMASAYVTYPRRTSNTPHHPPQPPPGAAPAAYHAHQSAYSTYSREAPLHAFYSPVEHSMPMPMPSHYPAMPSPPQPPPLPPSHPLFASHLPSPPLSRSSTSASTSYPSYRYGGGDAASSSGAPSILASAGSFSELSRVGTWTRSGSNSSGLDGRPESSVFDGQEEVVQEDPFGDEYSVAGDEALPLDEVETVDSLPRRGSGKAKDLFGTIWARRTSLRSPSARTESPEQQLDAAPAPAVAVEGEDGVVTSPTASMHSTTSEVTPLPSPTTARSSILSGTSAFTSPPTGSSSETGHTSLSPPGTSAASPTSPTASFSTFLSAPSSGGLVSDLSPGAAPFARADVLAGIRWGFVDKARAAMHPPLEHAGDFPRGAQLSLEKDSETDRELFACFAVEATAWQSLLVFLMWHGNSRLEAAPSDLQGDKLNRGLQASVSVDFFRSFTDHAPRVRVLLSLLPLDTSARPLSMGVFASQPNQALTIDPPTYDSDCPSIRLALSTPLTLPSPLSALATALSTAHQSSRAALRLLNRGSLVGGVSLSGTAATQLTDRAVLARAVDLFRRLNGEHVSQEEGDGGSIATVEDAEVGVLDRLKARLRGRRKPRVLEGAGGAGGAQNGRVWAAAGGGPLPEGAMLITPFSID
ncbi:hypothetical protein JCM10207_009078 [Rhodosporidiobolus poonsookiae]